MHWTPKGTPILYIGKLAYVMRTLRERIKTRLLETGLNQAELAKAAGVREPSVTDWCNGKTKTLKLLTALAAARALRTTVEWLATGKDSACDENGNLLGSVADHTPPPTPEPPPALPVSDAALLALARHVQGIIDYAGYHSPHPWNGVERRNITKI